MLRRRPPPERLGAHGVGGMTVGHLFLPHQEPRRLGNPPDVVLGPLLNGLVLLYRAFGDGFDHHVSEVPEVGLEVVAGDPVCDFSPVT